jgi:hypothetical protein
MLKVKGSLRVYRLSAPLPTILRFVELFMDAAVPLREYAPVISKGFHAPGS